MTTIALFGRGAFAAAVARGLRADGHTISVVVSPYADRPYHELAGTTAAAVSDHRPDPLCAYAYASDTRWVDAVTYAGPQELGPQVSLIIAAHSHNFIGRRTRAHARLAAVGYHPSLLPLHRGRDAVRWTVRDGDRVTGGSVYHLTDSIDAGPLAAVQHVLVPRGATASSLWREQLFPLGVQLLRQVAADADAGVVGWTPQDEALATWEPSWEREPLHRTELPELERGSGVTYQPAPGVWRTP